jgi:hypothetical protein
MSKYAAFNQGKRFADTKARAGAAQSKYIGFVVLICELIKSPRFATKAQKSGARKISRADYNTSKDPNCKQRSAHGSKRARTARISLGAILQFKVITYTHNTGGAAKKQGSPTLL